MKFVKRGGKVIKRVRKYAKKVNRNPVVKGVASVAKIAQMVRLLNVEKKRVDFNFQGSYLGIGQYNALVTGAASADVTPGIPQGVTSTTRNGNSLKLTSCCIDLFFKQQANAINAMRIKWFFVCKPDNAVDLGPNSALTQFLDPNPFSLVIDYHSSRDPEFFTSLKIIKQGVVTLSQDSLATGVSYQQRKVPLKLNHHLKYNTDGSTITTKNKFFFFFTADIGDRQAASLTGADVGFNIRYFYVDN